MRPGHRERRQPGEEVQESKTEFLDLGPGLTPLMAGSHGETADALSGR